MSVDSGSGMDTFLSIFPRYPPDIRVGVPVPGDLVFVSSCLVSLILLSGGKKTVTAQCVQAQITNTPN